MAEKMAEMFPPGVLEKALTEKTIDRYRLDTPAFCSKCGKSYYRKDALQRHIKECGRIPPLACPICPYRTFRKVSLSFKQFGGPSRSKYNYYHQSSQNIVETFVKIQFTLKGTFRNPLLN